MVLMRKKNILSGPKGDLVRIQAPVVLRHETEYFNYCIEKSRLKVETHELSDDFTKAQTASAC